MMNAITIRNLSDEVSRALEARAVRNGTTAEAEAEQILHDALAGIDKTTAEPPIGNETAGLGTALRQFGERYPEFGEIDFKRDQSLPRFVSFE